MKKSLALLLCTVLISGMLVGCGSTDKKEAEDTKSGKTWVVATDTVFKPFEYTNEKNEFVGIDVDILAAIAKDQGFEYELQSLGWDAGVAAVQAGQADALIAGATIKQDRIAVSYTHLTLPMLAHGRLGFSGQQLLKQGLLFIF